MNSHMHCHCKEMDTTVEHLSVWYVVHTPVKGMHLQLEFARNNAIMATAAFALNIPLYTTDLSMGGHQLAEYSGLPEVIGSHFKETL